MAIIIKFDEVELMDVFECENMATAHHSELGVYTYKYTREDGTGISLGFNKYEKNVSILIYQGNIISPHIPYLKDCEAIRVLDARRKQFEILVNGTPGLRCFVDLLGSIVITIEHIDQE